MIHTLADLLEQPAVAGAVLLVGPEDAPQRLIRWVALLDDDMAPTVRPDEVVVATQEMRESAQVMKVIHAVTNMGAAALILRLAPELVSTVRRFALALDLPVLILLGEVMPLAVGYRLVEWLVQENLPYATAHPQWLQYVVDGAALPELVQALAAHWQRSVVLLDHTGYPVGHAGSQGQHIVARWARWHASHLAESVPTLLPDDHLFVVPLHASPGLGGSLMTTYQGRLPTRAEHRMVLDACVAVGLAIERPEGAQGTKAHQREQLVWELVSGQAAVTVNAVAREKAFGFDVLAPTYALVGHVQGTAHQVRQVLLLTEERARENQVALLGAAVPSQIVLFVNVLESPDDMITVLHHIIAQMQSEHPPLVMSWGVSDPYTGVANFSKGYHDAQVACHLGQLLTGPGHVTNASQTAGYRILHKVSQDPDSRHFWEHYLGALVTPEDPKSAYLRETLEVYLATQGNASETARQLGIHRQTLIFRLQRIKEVTGCDLRDAQDCFALELSLRLYRLDAVSLEHAVEMRL